MSVRPFHHQRPLAAVAAAYGAGVWAGVRFSWHPIIFFAGLGLCVAAAALLPVIGRRRIVGVMGAFFFFGLLLSGHAAHPVLPQDGGYQVEGVASADALKREGNRAAVYLEHVTLEDGAFRFSLGRAYWTYYVEEEAPFLPREGERVRFTGRVYRPSGQMNPYGFDFRLFLLQRGVTAGITGCRDGAVTGRPGRGIRSALYRARQSLDQRVQEVFGADHPLPRALLIGNRAALPEDVAQSFSQVGLAHLLAVSGLHVGLLAEALMLMLRRWTSREVRLGVLGVFLLGYCALLDFSAPVVRASLLMALAFGRRLLRRQGDGLTALAAAFLVILIFRPLDLFSASFQLSFGAVLGIVMLLPQIRPRLLGLPFRALRESVGATLTATLGAALPTIQWFHRFSPLGVLLNPFACLAFGALLPLYAAALALSFVSLPAAMHLARGLNALSQGMTGIVEAAGALPFATVRVPFFPWYAVAAVVFALVVLTRYVVWPRHIRYSAAALAVLVSLGVWRLTESKDVRYIQLSVGQADAALILDGGQTTLLDAGDYGGDVADYLLSTGRRADRVILTHLHTDHCLGLKEVMEEGVPIGALYLPKGALEQQVEEACQALIQEIQAAGVPVYFLQAGDTLAGDRTALTVTWPQGDRVRLGQEANRYCLSLLCDLDGVALLNAGDLDGAFEMYAARDADVLKLSHHGSKGSTGEAFLDAVTPEIAFITASGSENAALPHPDTLDRLDKRGIPWYHTGQWGALTITVRDGQAALTTFLPRKEQP